MEKYIGNLNLGKEKKIQKYKDSGKNKEIARGMRDREKRFKKQEKERKEKVAEKQSHCKHVRIYNAHQKTDERPTSNSTLSLYQCLHLFSYPFCSRFFSSFISFSCSTESISWFFPFSFQIGFYSVFITFFGYLYFVL